MPLRRSFAAAVVALAAGGAALAHDGDPHPAIAGPADAYVFPLAAPGTYRLPPIRPAADASLLDEDGRAASLHGVFQNHLTVLAFVYTRCGDLCPLASLRLADLQALAAHDADVAPHLRLVSLSFDPAYDTPERMAEQAASYRDPAVTAPSWTFLTAADEATIAPVLLAYDQAVARRADPTAAPGPLAHVLRVFLIDEHAVVRNIYSADFLDPRLVLNDLRTLRMAGAPK